LRCQLLFSCMFLFSLLYFGNVSLKAFKIYLTIVWIWLVLVDIVTILTSVIHQSFALFLASNLFTIVSVFNLIINFAMKIFLNLFWHIRIVFQHLHTIDIIIVLVKFKWIETMLSLLLVVYFSSCLLFSNLLFGRFKSIIYGFQHIFLLFSLLALYFICI